MYAFRYDSATRILHVEMRDLWTVATFAAFLSEGLVRGTAIRLRDGPPASLFDTRRFPVQTAVVTKAMSAALDRANRISTSPAAVVVSSALAAMQAKRILTGDHVRVFLDWDEANAWLVREWSARRAA